MGWHLCEVAAQKIGLLVVSDSHLRGAVLAFTAAVSNRRIMRHLVTGGAGFIGANYVNRILDRGDTAIILDDLSRPGVSANIDWLRATHGTRAFTLVTRSVQDGEALTEAVRDADVVVHLAGQTAVTCSIKDPRADFTSNALGTLNVLEAARRCRRPPIVLYASTNKVYGPLDRIPVVEQETRYAYRDLPHGISEDEPLDFHSPYGCSKGAGDQYVRDYARMYGLRTVVLRQSCIYGPRQMGLEDQGWVAWFLMSARAGRPLHVYGTGKQVRDLLYVDDLADAYDAAIERIDAVSGQVFNLGGGAERSMSVWVEFAPLIERLVGRRPEVAFGPWRPGDQKVYVSDVRKAARELGWSPRVGLEDGFERLSRWIADTPDLVSRVRTR
jgi:CDP-paratose 2-epimerase